MTELERHGYLIGYLGKHADDGEADETPESPAEEAAEMKETSPEARKRIIDFVEGTAGLDDTAFHQFAESLGVDPHEAEELVYAHIRDIAEKRKAAQKEFDEAEHEHLGA